jgi:hypothetical protein
MSMSGMASSTRPAGSCKGALTSKARSASYAPLTVSFFTKAGARKLAHYVDREIMRVLARSPPLALPTEPATPDVAHTGAAGPRAAADRFPGEGLARRQAQRVVFARYHPIPNVDVYIAGDHLKATGGYSARPSPQARYS